MVHQAFDFLHLVVVYRLAYLDFRHVHLGIRRLAEQVAVVADALVAQHPFVVVAV